MSLSNDFTNLFLTTFIHIAFLWQWTTCAIFTLPTAPTVNRTAFMVPSNSTTFNSWLLVRGYTCIKQDNSQLDDSDETRHITASEESCVQACTAWDECRVAQWLDFSQLSDTGNQRYCSLYTHFDDCYGVKAAYFQKNERGLFTANYGKYCSLTSDNKPAISQQVFVAMQDLDRTNSTSPGANECQNDCVNNVQGTDNAVCTGFNYLPREMLSFLADESQVMPCWLFFTQPCAEEIESRIFFKAFSPEFAEGARRSAKKLPAIVDKDMSIVQFVIGGGMETTRKPVASTTTTIAVTTTAQSNMKQTNATASVSVPTSTTVKPSNGVVVSDNGNTAASTIAVTTAWPTTGLTQTNGTITTAVNIKPTTAAAPIPDATTAVSAIRLQTTVVYNNNNNNGQPRVPETQKGCSSPGLKAHLALSIGAIFLGKFLLFL